MNWAKFDTLLLGTKLEAGDLVWFQQGGLSYVTSDTNGKPSGFESIGFKDSSKKMGWSLTFDCDINQISKASQLKPSGWFYSEKEYYSTDSPEKKRKL